jgi:hypothetical protein
MAVIGRGSSPSPPFASVLSNNPAEASLDEYHVVAYEAVGLLELAADVDLLVSEAGYGLDAPDPEAVHLTAEEAGAAAVEAGARRLLLTHLAGADVEACVAAAAAAGHADVVGARVGTSITVGD